MANKVDMGEVHEMSKSIKKALNQLHSETETLSNNIDALNDNPDFKGQTANNIESYNNNFHKETINRLNNIKKKFESSLNNSIKAFHNNVDEDHKAKLDASAIADYKTDIEKPVKEIETTKGKVNDKVNSVSDLTSASPIHSHEVQEKLGNFTKHIDDTLNNLSDFSASHEGDDLDLAEMIIPVSTMTSKVKDMSSNRATIAGVGSDIKSQYKMADKNNPITDLKNGINYIKKKKRVQHTISKKGFSNF